MLGKPRTSQKCEFCSLHVNYTHDSSASQRWESVALNDVPTVAFELKWRFWSVSKFRTSFKIVEISTLGGLQNAWQTKFPQSCDFCRQYVSSIHHSVCDTRCMFFTQLKGFWCTSNHVLKSSADCKIRNSVKFLVFHEFWRPPGADFSTNLDIQASSDLLVCVTRLWLARHPMRQDPMFPTHLLPWSYDSWSKQFANLRKTWDNSRPNKRFESQFSKC